MEGNAEMVPDSSAVAGRKPAETWRKFGRAAVTNGTMALPDLDGRSASARRYKDILAAIVSDLGGANCLSEGQRQLARRAASLSYSCEVLEAQIIGGYATMDFRKAANGHTPFEVLEECAKLLHAVARVRGGDGPRRMAALAPDELGRVAELLTRAGDLSAKAIAARDSRAHDLELLGMLSARLTRVLSLLGLERRSREITPLPSISDSSDLQVEGEDRRTREEQALAAYLRLIHGHSQ
jgi:hypothetical protein